MLRNCGIELRSLAVQRATANMCSISSSHAQVDEEWVVDASKKGSISRLINHCCTPNSIARIVSIQGSKRIVIYAKDQIEPGDEVRRGPGWPR